MRTPVSFVTSSTGTFKLMLVGESADGGSMLRTKQFNTMYEEILQGQLIKLSISTEEGDHEAKLGDCLLFSSDAKYHLLKMSVKSLNEDVELGYPFIRFRGQKVPMHRIMFGVKNGTASILVYYMAFLGDRGFLQEVKKAELQWNERLKSRREDIVKLRLFGDAIVDEEIRNGAIGSLPYFITGSTLMVVFVFSTVVCYYKVRWHGAFLTMWTMLCPLLAGFSATGVFVLLGIPFNCVMLITPFLVLGVGVDDGFLMMQHWFHSKEIDGRTRLCDLLIQTGPSVSLTSFTNIAAFMIGSLLSTPNLQIFCLCTALALLFDWFFQLFAFAPALLFVQSYSYDLLYINNTNTKRMSPLMTYCEWLRKPVIRALLFSVVLLYWILNIYFGLQMKEDFSPEKTFDSESFLAKSLLQNEKLFYEHEMIRIFVTKPPKDAQILLKAVKKITSIEYVCNNFTTWIEEYEAEKFGDTNADLDTYFTGLGRFLSLNPSYLKDIIFTYENGSSVKYKKLSFDLCVNGFGSWRERALMLRDLRKRIPAGFSVYMEDAAVFDLILSARKSVTKSVMVTLICMIFLCAFFIPTFRATMAATISVASTTIGVIGGLYLLGADLDTMVLVNIVMAVGLTVDFSAHISYRCFICRDENKNDAERLASAIESIAYPTAQAALTTVACVFPLCFYRVYIYVTFAKTILLSAAIGFLHTVFVVPLLISLF